VPVPNVEQMKQKEAAIKKAIAGLGDAPDVAKRRALGKKLRRAQRRRRKMVVELARKAVEPKASGGEGGEAAKTEEA